MKKGVGDTFRITSTTFRIVGIYETGDVFEDSGALLRLEDDQIQLIPGESHYETYGYHLICDGQRLTQKPARPGKTGSLSKPGKYQAVAVELLATTHADRCSGHS